MTDCADGTAAGGRSAGRRCELIQAAAQVFVAEGYANCGVADIVAALGVGHGTFYNYFTSKRDVLDAVVDRGFELIRERIVDDALGRSADLDEFFDRYRRIVDRLHELVRQEPELIRFVVFEAPSIDPVLIDRLLGVFGQFGDVAAEFLASAVRRGDLHGAVDLEVAGEAMGSILLASAVFPLHGPVTAEDLAAPLVEFLRSGIGGPVAAQP